MTVSLDALEAGRIGNGGSSGSETKSAAVN